MKMKTTIGLVAPFLLMVAACGGETDAQGPEITVQSEAAGEECPTGGLRLEIDGEDYYVCNGDEGPQGEEGAQGEEGPVGGSPEITTSELAAGEGDNPCEGDALVVTVTSPEGEETVEYVCQAFDPVVEFVSRGFMAQSEIFEASAVANCQCNWEASEEYASEEECIEDNTQPYASKRFMTWCIDSAYHAYDRPAPQGFVDLVECEEEKVEGAVACFDVIEEGQACENEADADQCLDDYFENDVDCFDAAEEDDEAMEWQDDFFDFVQRYGCFESFGPVPR